MSFCPVCAIELSRRNPKFCSNKCQSDYTYTLFIKRWRHAEVDGGIGITAKAISGHIRKYLFAKYGDACTLCGWAKINFITGRVPLEIDHVDGNSENNSEINLRVICPNCHSLTASYRNLNRGHGRDWRRLKYIKN